MSVTSLVHSLWLETEPTLATDSEDWMLCVIESAYIQGHGNVSFYLFLISTSFQTLKWMIKTEVTWFICLDHDCGGKIGDQRPQMLFNALAKCGSLIHSSDSFPDEFLPLLPVIQPPKFFPRPFPKMGFTGLLADSDYFTYFVCMCFFSFMTMSLAWGGVLEARGQP